MDENKPSDKVPVYTLYNTPSGKFEPLAQTSSEQKSTQQLKKHTVPGKPYTIPSETPAVPAAPAIPLYMQQTNTPVAPLAVFGGVRAAAIGKTAVATPGRPPGSSPQPPGGSSPGGGLFR
ncbi:MAG: hypothetical protein LBU15_00965 [Rickettsiales bacterium]|jgi:hypothetical protein|nr:hypothetical protein [Rickettsiales bacterium]